MDYCIRPNYHTYPYKHTLTVKQVLGLQITACVGFVYFLKEYSMLWVHVPIWIASTWRCN